tara:strand:+ start:665 stop:1234 length:570 start_codon:yes stop_codon:yes gene_type:complete
MANNNVKSLKSAYDKAVKKEQALSSLMLVNLEKYKKAVSKGTSVGKGAANVEKYRKIAGQLSKKKKAASETVQKAYDEMDNAISGLHRDAELQIDEVRKLIRKIIINEAGVFDVPAETEPSTDDGGDQSRVMAKLQTKFEGPVKSIIDLIKTKDDLNTAVSMLISKTEETSKGLGKKAKILLLKTVKEL